MSDRSARRLDLVALRTFLEDAGVAVQADLTAELIAGGRSNLTFLVSDGLQRWVVRRPPTGGRTPSAHDVAREYQVARALESTGVPVARTVALCEDLAVMGTAFTVVEYVEGRVIRTQDELAKLDDDAVRVCVGGLVEALAGLHRVDHTAVGLAGFGRPRGYAARQLRRWASQWDIVSTDPSVPADRLLGALTDTVPEQRHSTIVHGDFRIDNTIIDDDDPSMVNAIVDWELSTIGDPLADAAMMCAYRHAGLNLVLGVDAAWTSDRLPSADALAAAYEAAAGISLDHWEFYLGLAYYKLAVIAQGINHRYRAGATVGDGFDTAGEAVTNFLDAGLRHVAGG